MSNGIDFDFNNAGEQKSGDLIPDKTDVKVVMNVRPGGNGDGGWLKVSQSGNGMLDCELTVTEGQYAKRKFWEYFVIGSNGSEKGNQAVNIARAKLRAIVESARGINPKDMTPEAQAKRRINSIDELNGLEFACSVKIQKGQNGYDDSNKMSYVITPDNKKYQSVMAGGINGNTNSPAPAATPVQTSSTPAWAATPQPQQQPAAPAQPQSPAPAWATQQPATTADDIPF